MKVREVIRLVEKDGWYLVRTKGGHRHFRHAPKPGTVTIPGNLGGEMPPGTLKSVLNQAGIEQV